MFSNHRLEIRGTDEGMWRRVRLIPWDVTIPGGERDEALGSKLAAEAPGILRWVVEGCKRYLVDGIGAPKCIVASTADYRAKEDTVRRFLSDIGVVYVTGGRVMSSDLTEAHEEWCSDNGLTTVREHWKRVTTELTSRGARAKREHRGRYWAGITILEDELVAPGQTHLPQRA
jgi:putative DNA primase/helicase